MGDGCFHGDDLLGLLLFLDVVGPQGDLDGAAQRTESGVGVWSHRTQPRGREGQVAVGVGRTEVNGETEATGGPRFELFVSSASQKLR